MGGVVFALLAALCNAVSVIARHIASTADPDRPTGLRLVGYLLRNPGWLAGSAAQVGAFACQAVALHLGELSVVQPLLVVELVLALILRRLWIHQAIAGAAWAGAVASCAGLAWIAPALLKLSFASAGGRSIWWAMLASEASSAARSVVLAAETVRPCRAVSSCSPSRSNGPP